MMNRRGQAAMEFLITYGWAILAAIVAIGVLAFFLSNPSRFASNSCAMTAPFTCDDFLVNTSGINLELINGGGDTIVLTSMQVNGTSNCMDPSLPATWAPGTTQGMNLDNCDTVPTGGEAWRGDITITYTKSGGTFEQAASGTITYRVT